MSRELPVSMMSPAPRRRLTERELLVETAKILLPVLLAWFLAVYTARGAAREQVERDLAIVKTTEQLHFEEIQRSLQRINTWIDKQEGKK
jgi:hypothetical protein